MLSEGQAVAEHLLVVRGRMQQQLVDAEVGASRRVLLSRFRDRLRRDATTLTDPEFLAVADEPVVSAAVLVAAAGATGARALDLRGFDPVTRSLSLLAQRGLPPVSVLDSAVDVTGPVHEVVAPPWLLALVTGEPAVVEDLAAGVFRVGSAARTWLLGAGIRAVASYPLRDHGGLVSWVLTVYDAEPGARPFPGAVLEAVQVALAQLARCGPRPENELVHADVTVETHVGGHRAGTSTTVAVTGSLDALTVPDFTAVAGRVLAGLAAPHRVVVDLRTVDFVAVAGARALLGLHEECRSRSVECWLVTGPDDVVGSVLARLDAPAGLRIVTDPGLVTGTERAERR